MDTSVSTAPELGLQAGTDISIFYMDAEDPNSGLFLFFSF